MRCQRRLTALAAMWNAILQRPQYPGCCPVRRRLTVTELQQLLRIAADRTQDAVVRSVALLTAHQRIAVRSCLCGWDELEKSFAAHQVDAFRAMGLLRSEEPLLGLATTRQLLEELKTRGEISALATFEPYRPAYERLAEQTSILIEGLPSNVLDYQTVNK